MSRVSGDTEELPEGWSVDNDNWATRTLRPTDRLDRRPEWPNVIHTEGRRVYCADAQEARFFDGDEL